MTQTSWKLLMVVAGTVLATVNMAYAYTGQELAPAAKISVGEARSIALHAFPGKIVSEELEQERGNGGLRYFFDIRRGKTVQEVNVDAVSGKVLKNVPEGPNPD